MELFPAVLIGGPPHVGKSVLAYSLTQALRRRRVDHYVLRAYPDGEGDWFHEADRGTVRALRVKGEGTPAWIGRICRDIANRHLPLLVDVGGRPTAWQEAVFDHCTHAVLLTPDPASHAAWTDLLARHGLPLLADLRSDLRGRSAVSDAGPVLRGTITGLERGTTAAGALFEALVERLAALFAYTADELRATHLAQAPVETVIELEPLGRTLGVPGASPRWQPRHLRPALDYLPAGRPLGLYGRGPNWLYAALALHAHPAPLHQFDPRLGWVEPPSLRLAAPPPGAPLQATARPGPDHTRLDFRLPAAYLDHAEASGLAVPPVPAGQGVVLSGQLPHWLWTALALAYRPVAWIAVYQPHFEERAVVVGSRLPQPALGDLVHSPP